MKILVAFSGGKDSLAALLWTLNEGGFNKDKIEAVFCDTGWEHELTYQHIDEVIEKLGVKLVTVKSKKYDGFVDMAKKKKRFPSTKARFCTEELKTKPMIDYILDEVKDNVIIIQGIRADESAARSKMAKQCRYFRYYFEPYGYDKKGKPKFHNYRKKEVKEFCKQYADDVLRPCFDWGGTETMQYILDAGLKPNPLYYMNAARVGCFPCMMCKKREVKAMIDDHPAYVERLQKAEAEVGRTFFPPDYIPKKYRKMKDEKSGVYVGTINDVIRYVKDRNLNMDLFEEDDKDGNDRKCMSFYGICE